MTIQIKSNFVYSVSKFNERRLYRLGAHPSHFIGGESVSRGLSGHRPPAKGIYMI
jgi:hypothetical protein